MGYSSSAAAVLVVILVRREDRPGSWWGANGWRAPGKTVTVATRVSPEHLAEIEDLAGQLDVPVAALLRGWILAGLSARRDETVQTAIERLSADVQRLRELVA